MTERQRLHVLVENLPEDELHVARRFLEFLEAESSESPLLQALENAPFDDEPLTAEEEAALDEAESDLAEGHLISHSDARHRLLGK